MMKRLFMVLCASLLMTFTAISHSRDFLASGDDAVKEFTVWIPDRCQEESGKYFNSPERIAPDTDNGEAFELQCTIGEPGSPHAFQVEIFSSGGRVNDFISSRLYTFHAYDANNG